MDSGEEPIQHSAELAVVRRQARRIHVGAVVVAAALTAVVAGLAALV
jgi:hypothetical protein